MSDRPTGEEGHGTEIRTFLIADVRGYTLFTQERGDEAAAKLAARFAEVAEEEIETRGGTLIEIRGDEALAVFSSPRQALRAATEMQARFVEETFADLSIPLGVGIGIDAGEAVPVEGGYRGGALNQAARLCALAGPGEVIASREVVHLARAVEGLRYVDRGEFRLKGLPEPVRLFRVLPEGEDPAVRLAPLAIGREAARPGPIGRVVAAVPGGRFGVAVLAAILAAAVAVPIVILGGPEGLPGIDANAVGIIDPESATIAAQVPVGTSPAGVASGEGAVWVANGGAGTVSRIDPRNNLVVDTIRVGEDPAGIAVGAGSVWVANSGGRTVSRISPVTNEIAQTIDVGNRPTGIAFGDGALWVTNTNDGTISRIDPAEGEVEATIDAGPSPQGIAVGEGSVWTANSAAGSVARIDRKSNTLVSSITVGNNPLGITVGAGAVWVANHLDGTVTRIDPADDSVSATIPVGDGPNGIAASTDAVWVANELEGTVARVDPDTNEVETINVGSSPAGATLVGKAPWITTRAGGASHRGGTLKLLSEPPGSTTVMDPVLTYGTIEWQTISLTHDGLVAYKRVGGADGSTIVPDLATSVPQPTDGGSTYTFRLRPGIRFSNGKEVRPADVRHSIERIFEVRYPEGDPSEGLAAPAAHTGYYSGIIGADDCGEGPCDLSDGILVDDQSRTVTFRLSAPDPDFLLKLAIPFASVVPEGTPAEAVEFPLGTGPYVAQSEPGVRYVFVRNREFREWSRAAQPDGFPDRIVWRVDLSPDEQLEAVLDGDADVTENPPKGDTLATIATQYSGRLHQLPGIDTIFLALNTRVPPFDDVRARRAFNYAVNREAVAEMFRRNGAAVATCQLIPPDLPGYKPYCPYTKDPGPGRTWSAPDLDRARELVEASGTAGREVRIYSFEAPGIPEPAGLGRYMATVLEDLGYRVALTVEKNGDRFFETVSDSGSGFHVMSFGWLIDYPAPSTFVLDLFTCDSFVPNQVGNLNISQFCDPAIDAAAERAVDLQATDPVAASRAWADIDRAIVDRAPFLPMVNVGFPVFVSERLGNVQTHPFFGLLLSQLWVR